eukprot:CAMPEP_0168381762 /NCGR_PEP_ID=MMETSP0228-20121227/13043_1 /TAXON_ID=133427 /ORGANISM="Protoceratium reticulatum, Strain CCCM 535 (=CCMP 1889)" /LENGTH=404 /DNA_ID=CAMNT_0008394869 /DNA_START=52 /DNA_END=1263 /DNA_ORIENTATION=+
MTEIDPVADRLFVTKIPQSATREDIAAHFSRFGTTTDVYLPAVPGVVGHKGIAFVSYSDPTALQLAIGNGPHEIQGHEVVVDVAAPRGVQSAGQAPGPPGVVASDMVQEQAQPTADRLFVTKVPPALQREHLREHFAQFGDLTDVYMPAVPGGNTHKGICFVSFSDPASLQLALQHSPHEIHGHQVVVDVAAPRGPVPGAGAARGPCQGYGMGMPLPQHLTMPQVGPGWGINAFSGTTMAGMPPVPGGGLAPAVAAAAPGNLTNSSGSPVLGRLFVTRVTPDMTKVDLQLYFQQFGQLEDVYIPTGGKGIAFVSFRDSVVSQRVLQAQQHFVKPGKAVLVDQALDRPPLVEKAVAASAVGVSVVLWALVALHGVQPGSLLGTCRIDLGLARHRDGCKQVAAGRP